ncbi:MAG: hypothetical protein QM753_07535 [Thermomicrobiales bacterium]
MPAWHGRWRPCTRPGCCTGDIKPSNIMLTADRKPKLIDLGQACRTGTTKKRIQGTPEFMAPE